jgi:hypothetical protein
MNRLAALALAATSLLAGGAHSGPYHPPRTRDGAPDLQGVWNNASFTRLQRPTGFGALEPTEAEARAFEGPLDKSHREMNRAVSPDAPAPAPSQGVGESEWREFGFGLARINGRSRTSWIVDPADGKIPFTPAAQAASDAADRNDAVNFDNPENRNTADRCLLGTGSPAGPPLLNHTYNANYQIVQTRDAVVIVAEMNHDARIVRLDAKGHLPAAIRPWMGDSIGWWEGDALVVETTNFNPGESWRWNNGGSAVLSKDAKVVERFVRVGPSRILYAFEMDDPANYTRPWRGEEPLLASREPMFEYACHEGNLSMTSELAGARRFEREGLTAAPAPR